ncbi:hypothetical protein DPMN_012309 [Dreissena polymorpha]|uniref:Uncharacterized protein n=1 Tax=Dreissena polymorpha TaxID=45954 RepID=A0A9D4N257_DREPO|nr:hypothetical protein DPMN_012309 [Dreissena polymorpha]
MCRILYLMLGRKILKKKTLSQLSGHSRTLRSAHGTYLLTAMVTNNQAHIRRERSLGAGAMESDNLRIRKYIQNAPSQTSSAAGPGCSNGLKKALDEVLTPDRWDKDTRTFINGSYKTANYEIHSKRTKSDFKRCGTWVLKWPEEGPGCSIDT